MVGMTREVQRLKKKIQPEEQFGMHCSFYVTMFEETSSIFSIFCQKTEGKINNRLEVKLETEKYDTNTGKN